jgi:hypothetical protein
MQLLRSEWREARFGVVRITAVQTPQRRSAAVVRRVDADKSLLRALHVSADCLLETDARDDEGL